MYNANLELVYEGGTPELGIDANEAAMSLLRISSLAWKCAKLHSVHALTHVLVMVRGIPGGAG